MKQIASLQRLKSAAHPCRNMLEIRTVCYPLQNSLASLSWFMAGMGRRGRNHTIDSAGVTFHGKVYSSLQELLGRHQKPVSAPTVGNGRIAVGCRRSCHTAQEKLRWLSQHHGTSCPSSRTDNTSPHVSFTETVHSGYQQILIPVGFVGWLQKASKQKTELKPYLFYTGVQ